MALSVAVRDADCCTVTDERPTAFHIRYLTGVVLGLVFLRCLAIDNAKQNHAGDNCCLLSCEYNCPIRPHPTPSLCYEHSHSGRFSSHFFLRLLQVIHPLLVRLPTFIFGFFGSDCTDFSLLSFSSPVEGLPVLSSSPGLVCS
jgi:hypothetical protein